jgi:hypothetical protein
MTAASPCFVHSLPAHSRPLAAFPRAAVLATVASGGDGGDGGGDSTDSDDARPSPEDVRRGRVNDLRERLDRLQLQEEAEDARAAGRAERYFERETQLIWLTTKFARTLFADCDAYLGKPVRKLTAASLAILFGFFSATSASTIIGSVADWDPLAAAVLLVWTEAFTRLYYTTDKKTLLLRLVNAFKIGLVYGMAVDAFKLST